MVENAEMANQLEQPHGVDLIAWWTVTASSQSVPLHNGDGDRINNEINLSWFNVSWSHGKRVESCQANLENSGLIGSKSDDDWLALAFDPDCWWASKRQTLQYNIMSRGRLNAILRFPHRQARKESGTLAIPPKRATSIDDNGRRIWYHLMLFFAYKHPGKRWKPPGTVLVLWLVFSNN